jgi:hypothetical protein
VVNVVDHKKIKYAAIHFLSIFTTKKMEKYSYYLKKKTNKENEKKE